MRKLAALGAMVVGLFFVPVAPALAACHHFSVNASPDSVTEGGSVGVTVSRDGSVGPSNIDVSTVDQTAKAGQDYTALRRTVNFTSETSQAFQVKTTDDNQPGGAKTFRLHLSNPGGCAVNPNFVVDPDVTVTINDNGSAATVTTAGATTTTASVPSSTARAPSTARTTAIASTTTAAPTSATVAPSSTEATTSTTPLSLGRQASGTPKRSRGGGSRTAIAAIAAAVIAVGAGGGYAIYRRRRALM